MWSVKIYSSCPICRSDSIWVTFIWMYKFAIKRCNMRLFIHIIRFKTLISLNYIEKRVNFTWLYCVFKFLICNDNKDVRFSPEKITWIWENTDYYVILRNATLFHFFSKSSVLIQGNPNLSTSSMLCSLHTCIKC